MDLLEIRKFLIQDDIYKLEILEDAGSFREFYKVYRNGELLVTAGKYSNALRCIITAYEIPAKEGRAYIMEGTEYNIITHPDCCTLIYKYRIDSSYTMSVFDDECHCLNWILCEYHYRD